MGYIAKLPEICDLAEEYDAMVMVDDSHSVGFMGKNGRGTAEHCGVEGRVDIITGTLGKALGGASGGYTAASAKVVDWLRQRSRPYLFSNTLAPVIAQTSIAVFDMLAEGVELRARLQRNAVHFRTKMGALGFELLPGDTRSSPSCCATRNWHKTWRPSWINTASLSPLSAFQLYSKPKTASAPKCQRPIPSNS